MIQFLTPARQKSQSERRLYMQLDYVFVHQSVNLYRDRSRLT